MTSEERQAYLKNLPGYIILVRKPNDPVIYGTVENSWSLGIEPNRAFLYWTARGRDGHTWAKNDLISFYAKHPDWEFTIYDARDEEKLPVCLNWDLWLDAHQLSSQTVSGVKNKHEARNLRFTLKGQAISGAKTALPLKATASSIRFTAPISVGEVLDLVPHLEHDHTNGE